MVNWRQESFDEWSRDIQALIDDTKKPLRYSEYFEFASHAVLCVLLSKFSFVSNNYKFFLLNIFRDWMNL